MIRFSILAVTCSLVLLAGLLQSLGCDGAPIDSQHLLSESAAVLLDNLPVGGTLAPPQLTSSSSTASVVHNAARTLHAADPTISESSSSTRASLNQKKLLPLGARDVVLFILCFGVLALAAGAGIGGGVLLVPLLSALGGFHFITTVALSNVAIFSGAITNMCFNLPRRHPNKPGPLIDYDLLLLFGPPLVMGSVAGSKANYFVPSWITKALVLVVLLPTAWRMVTKARLLWVAESKRKKETLAAIRAAAADDDDGDDDATAASSEHGIVSSDAACYVPHNTGLNSQAAQPANFKAQPYNNTPGVTPVSSRQHSMTQVPGSQPLTSVSSTPLPTTNAAHTWQQARFQRSYSAGHSIKQGYGRHKAGRPLPLLRESGGPESYETDIANLLGPELMLLTTPAAAAATLEVQHSSRQAAARRRQQVRSQSLQLRNSSSSSFAGSFRRSMSVMGSRAGSMIAGRGSGALAGATSMVSSTSGRATQPSVAAAAAAAVAAADRDNATVVDCKDVSAVQDPCTGEETQEESAWEAGPTITPFLLHQRTLLSRQESMPSFRRTGSSFKRHGSFASPQLGSSFKSDVPALPAKGLLPIDAKSRCRRLFHDDCCHTPELEEKMRHKIEHHAAAQYPKKHLAALLSTLLVVVVAVLCANMLLTCGTWQYWLVSLAPLPIMALIWGVACWHVLWRTGWQACLDLLAPEDIHWNTHTILLCPAVCVAVGVLAGLLGLGGGIVMAPLLLELGVNPATSAASSQAAMLISTCTSSVIYLANGAVPQDYGITMALIGFIGTLFGQTLISYLVKRTGRTSLLVFSLALLFIMAVAAGLVVVALAIVQTVEDPSRLTLVRKDHMC